MLKPPYYNWPTGLNYNSPEGWEFEKKRAYEVIKLKCRMSKLDKMLSKCADMRSACLLMHDTVKLLKYVDIEIRLLDAHAACAEALIYYYREPIIIK